MTAALRCPGPRVSPPSMGMGPLYGCVSGRAETVKVFINADAANPSAVRDVKVMWNEYTRDIGEGLAADRNEARQAVSAAADLYAPRIRARIVDLFLARRNSTLMEGPYRVEYRFSPGPSAGEHLLTITAR